jgi:hypothetical protein
MKVNQSGSGVSRKFGSFKRKLLLGVLFSVLPFGATQADILDTIVDVIVDGGNNYNWQKVELPGTKCGNGSQYKFFVHRTASPNVLFYFEGGGACWDYESCSGQTGILGAANPNGITDDYMTQFKGKYVSPLVNGADPGLPLRSRTDLVTKGWNVVFMPYCTGDVHVGNNVVTYTDSSGQQAPLNWHHAGYTNTLAAADYVAAQIPSIGKMLVSGFSAGGTATISAYYNLRRTLNPQKGYMINDSGPIYPAASASALSKRLHNQIRTSWDLDSVFADLPAAFDINDFGSINRMVSQEFPGDQLAYTAYSRDFNYSRFSYERFYPGIDKETILSYWKQDQDNLVSQMNGLSNFSYFLPWEREINESHCTTIITFLGSHACQKMEKKRYWWEYMEWPWGQTYKCYSEFVPFDTFLSRFVSNDQRVRIYEPKNGYNAEDPGMGIVGPIINGALTGL